MITLNIIYNISYLYFYFAHPETIDKGLLEEEKINNRQELID